jgi:hypothetical protein
MPLLSDMELTDRAHQLPPLAITGYGAPLVALARARYLRQRALEILWQETPGDGERARLLALVCARREVHWWCRPDVAVLLVCLRPLLVSPQPLPS